MSHYRKQINDKSNLTWYTFPIQVQPRRLGPALTTSKQIPLPYWCECLDSQWFPQFFAREYQNLIIWQSCLLFELPTKSALCPLIFVYFHDTKCMQVFKNPRSTPVLTLYLMVLRWEFIKENKKVRKQEKTLSTKRAIKKKRRMKKHALDQESFLGRFLGRERVFFLFFSFLVFFYKFPPLDTNNY